MEQSVQQEHVDSGVASVIGANISITGNIEATVDLMIEGQVTGDIRCKTLVTGENSAIKGNIFAERTRVSGLVEGAIDSGDLAVESTGNVVGEISYMRLKIAAGGVIEGNMKCKREQPQKLKLVEPKKEPRHVVIE